MTQLKSVKVVNLRLLIITVLSVTILLIAGLYRVTIDFDILNSLPDSNPVVSDAKYIFTHHPFQDRVVIDIGTTGQDLPKLIDKARRVESELQASGLFSQVGFKDSEHLIPGLLVHVVDYLPYLFSEKELDTQVKPLLAPEQINSQLTSLMQQLAGIEGVGQTRFMAGDPLAFRNLILARLGALNPVKNADFYQGFPLSQNNQHALVIATPKGSGTNTAASREISKIVESLEATVNNGLSSNQTQYKITAVGSYRAALDNETIVRRDTQKAIVFATIGIGLLLLISFPRPYLGLLSLIPALVGTIAAFFICSLLLPSLSILAIGFGGAIISITVDHSIAYLLFLDRPEKVYVKQAATEVRSIGFIAVLTTVGAFLVLTFSGFSILAQIGQFAALGIACSFIFVHTVFPRLIPVIPPAKKKSSPWLLRLVNLLQKVQTPVLPMVFVLFALVMAYFATPHFDVDLNQMNTVSPETLAAEQTLVKTWGNISNKLHLMLEADSLADLQENSDRLTVELEKAVQKQQIEPAFTASAMFPGKTTALANLYAWQKFWTPKRIKEVTDQLQQTSGQLGFTDDAFLPFLEKLKTPLPPKPPAISAEFTELLGIRHDAQTNKWLMFSTLTPKTGFNSQEFKSSLLQHLPVRLFDPNLFSSELGKVLSTTFIKMLLIISISVICLIFLFFLDLKLTLLSLVPILFSLICTLGTLNLLGHPLDIPGLMLAIIVIGMGIDYSLFMIRSYQRYSDEMHPFHGLIRMAVILAAASTMVGFGILVSAEHYLLHSAGLVSLLGIGYALIGAFILMPPLLRKMFIEHRTPALKGKTRLQRTLRRYANLEAYPRMFARFKMKLDPMFSEIDSFLNNPVRIIDIGCGFGVPAAWILDKYPHARFYGLDPDAERVRVANRMLGENGVVQQGYSPDLPDIDGTVDTVMMLDMLHYLNSEQLAQAFKNAFAVLEPNGRLIIRVTLPIKQKVPWYRRVESFQIRFHKGLYYYRELQEILDILRTAGFIDIQTQPSGQNREETWITGRIAATVPSH